MTASLQVLYNMSMAKKILARRNIESQPPRDTYEYYFQLGQMAARLSEKAKNPNGTFTRIFRLGLAADKENMPQTRVLRWVR